MCGIIAVVGVGDAEAIVQRALPRLAHRGPDGQCSWGDGGERIALGHARLSIIDLSHAGDQPMHGAGDRYVLAFNGELYNHVELRTELAHYPFRSHSDTEVALAAWAEWGPACLDRFIGMFAFVLWDRVEHTLHAVRDRLGVKPLYVAELPGGALGFASEIAALHACGAPREPDEIAWATYLTSGLLDHSRRTFWRGVSAVEPGTHVAYREGAPPRVRRWYDLAAAVGDDYDRRPIETVVDEYLALMHDSVRLRFRSDVPVGINLSGGLDSSILLAIVQAVRGPDASINVYSFATGDPSYDELPWVEQMLATTRHPLRAVMLEASEVPALAARIARFEDEPFGGVPTLAYGALFARARADGVLVLLDGQGMDEQWAGYDYFVQSENGAPAPIVQGSSDRAVRPECLMPSFAQLAEPFHPRERFPDRLRNLQLRDAVATKIPRALRFNDRVSMAASTELREPFLDHRLFELAFRQPPERKVQGGVGKWLLREMAARLVPEHLRLAPKRPVQTPQREWLRGPLRGWSTQLFEQALVLRPGWLDPSKARAEWQAYMAGRGDNSYWIWQWLSIALHAEVA